MACATDVASLGAPARLTTRVSGRSGFSVSVVIGSSAGAEAPLGQPAGHAR